MGEQYYKGVFAAFLGANFFCGITSEWQIDMVKEYISQTDRPIAILLSR